MNGQLFGSELHPCEVRGSLEQLIRAIGSNDSDYGQRAENLLRLLLLIEHAGDDRDCLIEMATIYAITQTDKFRDFSLMLMNEDPAKMFVCW
jgi:hypothetical protein